MDAKSRFNKKKKLTKILITLSKLEKKIMILFYVDDLLLSVYNKEELNRKYFFL